MGYFVGTDVGGTFTDLWIAEASSGVRVFKTPTTADVLGGVIDGLHHTLRFPCFIFCSLKPN